MTGRSGLFCSFCSSSSRKLLTQERYTLHALSERLLLIAPFYTLRYGKNCLKKFWMDTPNLPAAFRMALFSPLSPVRPQIATP